MTDLLTTCLVLQGKFSVNNLTVDASTIAGFVPDGNKYYMARWEVFDEKLTRFACFIAEADFPRVHA